MSLYVSLAFFIVHICVIYLDLQTFAFTGNGAHSRYAPQKNHTTPTGSVLVLYSKFLIPSYFLYAERPHRNLHSRDIIDLVLCVYSSCIIYNLYKILVIERIFFFETIIYVGACCTRKAICILYNSVQKYTFYTTIVCTLTHQAKRCCRLRTRHERIQLYKMYIIH